jgi:hypothetical protein
MIELTLNIWRIFIMWNYIGFCILFIIPYTRNVHRVEEIFNPKEIYNNTEVNWFGCIMLTILFNLLCPAMTIGYWLRWLCTVGRKDK